jgi:hypothetical protein
LRQSRPALGGCFHFQLRNGNFFDLGRLLQVLVAMFAVSREMGSKLVGFSSGLCTRLELNIKLARQKTVMAVRQWLFSLIEINSAILFKGYIRNLLLQILGFYIFKEFC